MKNDDTTHRSKCAVTCRLQLMLNLSGDNTVSLQGIARSRKLSGDVRKVQETSQIRWLMYCKTAICKSGQF